MSAVLNVFLLSLIAGLGAGVGGLIAITHKPGKRSFGFLMGITAGVMLTLAFVELVNEAWELQGYVTATIGFSAGAVFMLALDILVPHIRFGERETALFEKSLDQDVDQEPCPRGRRRGYRHHGNKIIDQSLFKTGTLLAIGITIHNIPEGIATALPLWKSGVSRWNSFKVALFSGFAEPVGALIAAFFLESFRYFVPVTLAFAGGVMVFITLDELLPAAREYGHQHYTAVGIILGAIFVFLLSGFFGV
jgi:ZIP family zinc transporter